MRSKPGLFGIGLDGQVPNYDYALDMVLDIEPNDLLSDDQQVASYASIIRDKHI